MNICFLSKTQLEQQGGIESYTQSISNVLASLGHTVHIIAAANNSGVTQLQNNLYIHKIKFNNLTFRGSWRVEKIFPFSWLVYSWLVSRRLSKIIKEYSIDLVESPNWCLEGFWYCFKKHTPLIVRLHVCTSEYLKLGIFPSIIRGNLTLKFERYLNSHADSLIAVSKYLASRVIEEQRLKKEIKVIPNVIELNIFCPAPEKEAKNPVILFVGRLEMNKGIKYLADSIPAILNNFPDTEFIFIGRDTKYPGYEKSWGEYLKEKIKTKNITVLNKIPHERLPEFYQKSWVYVLPSLSEAFGLTVLEAMACGKPVIATRIGGLAELVEHGETGILISPKDSIGLTNAILELINNDKLREKMGKKAIERIESEFNIDRITKMNLDIYEKAIESSKCLTL